MKNRLFAEMVEITGNVESSWISRRIKKERDDNDKAFYWKRLNRIIVQFLATSEVLCQPAALKSPL